MVYENGLLLDSRLLLLQQPLEAIFETDCVWLGLAARQINP